MWKHKEYLIYFLVPWKSWLVSFVFRWVIDLGVNFGCDLYFTCCLWVRNLYCHRNSELQTEVLKLYFCCRSGGLGALVFPPSLFCKWNVFNCSLALSIPLWAFWKRPRKENSTSLRKVILMTYLSRMTKEKKNSSSVTPWFTKCQRIQKWEHSYKFCIWQQMLHSDLILKFTVDRNS